VIYPEESELAKAAVILGRVSGLIESMSLDPASTIDLDFARAAFLADLKEDIQEWMETWANRDNS
jgi:hypothetical protein